MRAMSNRLRKIEDRFVPSKSEGPSLAHQVRERLQHVRQSLGQPHVDWPEDDSGKPTSKSLAEHMRWRLGQMRARWALEAEQAKNKPEASSSPADDNTT
jgi:hypothetical protein